MLDGLLSSAWNRLILRPPASLGLYQSSSPSCGLCKSLLAPPALLASENLLLPPWEPFLSSESENLAPGLVSHQLPHRRVQSRAAQNAAPCCTLSLKNKLLSAFAERIGRMVAAAWKNTNVLSIFISCGSGLEKS